VEVSAFVDFDRMLFQVLKDLFTHAQQDGTEEAPRLLRVQASWRREVRETTHTYLRATRPETREVVQNWKGIIAYRSAIPERIPPACKPIGYGEA
jgi:hypothetical protein